MGQHNKKHNIITILAHKLCGQRNEIFADFFVEGIGSNKLLKYESQTISEYGCTAEMFDKLDEMWCKGCVY